MSIRQLELLTFIRNNVIYENRIPTYKEMKNFLRVTSNKTLEEMVLALIRDGYLERNKEKFRGIRLTPEGMTLGKKVLIEESKTLPLAPSYSVPNNASTPNSFISIATGVTIQTNGVIPWMKGGEKNGTT